VSIVRKLLLRNAWIGVDEVEEKESSTGAQRAECVLIQQTKAWARAAMTLETSISEA
jgi:hypothetical protein